MELKHYTRLLWTWAWLILLSMVAAGSAAFWVSEQMTPVYETSATLRINQAPASSGTPDYQSLLTSERLSQTYAEILQSRPILEEVIGSLNLPYDWKDLATNVRVTAIRDTQLIELTVQDTDPQRAADIANNMIDVFIQQEQEMQNSRYVVSKQSLTDQLQAIQDDIDQAQERLSELERRTRRTSEQQDEYEQLQNQLLNDRSNYTAVLQSLENVRLAEAQSTNNLMVVQDAVPDLNPVRPRTLQNTVLATMVGALLAVGVVFLREYLDETVKNDDELEQLTDLPMLVAISRIKERGDTPESRLVTVTKRNSPIAESYRVLRANIEFSSVDRPIKTFVVTSAGPGEGKTTTIANLAVTLAQAGRRIILVDTDLRRPTLHKHFGLSNEQGLTTALLDQEHPPDTYIQATGVDNLRLLASGPLPPNPAELIGSHRMTDVVDALTANADMVLFDSPPLLAVVDASLLARMCDATLLVVQAATTKSSTLLRARDQLLQTGARVVGTVFNQVASSRMSYSYQPHLYYYNQTQSRKEQQYQNGSSLASPHSHNGQHHQPDRLSELPDTTEREGGD